MMDLPGRQISSTSVDERYRMLLMIWFALLSSVGTFFFVTLFIPGSAGDDVDTNGTLTLALAAVGILMVIVSFIVKQKIVAQAAVKRDLKLVQTGYIVALALCEMAALPGLILYVVLGARHYYLLFIISALGVILHLPRREHLLNASAPAGQ
jgi:hypothetical protein